MKYTTTCRYSLLLTVLLLALFQPVLRAADVVTPCFLKLSIFTNIAGTAVADLVGDPRYPGNPSQIFYLKSFNTRDALRNDSTENFGGLIEGFITPAESGDYHFFLRSDDSSELWLSSDDSPANAQLIAEELDCCDQFSEPDTGDLATSAAITLTQGRRYYVKLNYKSSTSTDFAMVAWRKSTDTTPATALRPIPGAFLSATASDAGASVNITQPPQNVTVAENGKATLTLAATTTPTNNVCIQWQRNGVNIPGASGSTYTFFVDQADSGAKYRAVVAVPGAFTPSAEATLTVTPDTLAPTLLEAKGGPNRPEVTLTFSERVNAAAAGALANYQISSSTGNLAVTEASVIGDGTKVKLVTNPQTPGVLYTVRVSNLTDLGASPRTIAANSQAAFTARGPLLQGDDGFVVFEAEDYDRDLDGRWEEDSVTRTDPSGGIAMLIPNGAGGNEGGTKLEYDILFTKTGTHILWFRGGGNDGGDDSAWMHLDGDRPANRTQGNQAAMAIASSLVGNLTWRSQPFEGAGQFTFIIETAGLHTISAARREDGTFLDKFVITTDPTFNPTTVFGQLGPAPTLRQGDPPPAGAVLEFTLHPTNMTTAELGAITLRGAVTNTPGSLVGYQWQRRQGGNFVDIPNATGASFTIGRTTLDWNGAVVRLRAVSAGVTKFSSEATITVIADVAPPQILRASGLATPQKVTLTFSEPLEATTAQNLANYRLEGPSGAVNLNAATQFGDRIVVLDTGGQVVGAKYTVTVTGLLDQAAAQNRLTNAQAKFFSLGALQPQGADGLIVFEAENFDRNLDERWTVDALWGNPSGGFSVVLPNGIGGATEAGSKLEYDVTFTQSGVHYLWYLASGPNGNDDSSFFHLDGARPAERATGNQASMQVINGTQFVWNNDPQDGNPPFTVQISAGQRVIGLAYREDGTYFDKFLITTNASLNPNSFGPFGPPETRQGLPPLPSITISTPTNAAKFADGAAVTFTVAINATGRVPSKVEYFSGATKLGESTTAPFGFSWTNAATGTYAITALVTDDVGDTARSVPVIITVGDPNDVLFLVGNPNLNAAAGDLAVRNRLAALGFNVIVVDDNLSVDTDAIGKKLIVVSSTVGSGNIATKYRNSAVPVVSWEGLLQDDFGMTADVDGVDRGGLTNQTQIKILGAAHPLSAGLTVGVVTVTTAPTDVSWGAPATNAVRIASVVTNESQVVIYGYDAGAAMVGGFTAPARRVHLFLADTTYTSLSQDGLNLFDAAINWALTKTTGTDLRVTAARGAGGLTLQWTGGAPPYRVQKKTSLNDASWTDVATLNETTTTVPMSGASGFFRVSSP